MMCTMTKINGACFVLLSLLLVNPLYGARAKSVRSTPKKTELNRALLYDTQGQPISDTTVRSLTEIEAEALASLARTEGYEGVALIFKNESMDFVETASEYAEAALEAKLRAYDYAVSSSEYAVAANVAKNEAIIYVEDILNAKNIAASYETSAGSSSELAGSYSQTASTVASQAQSSLQVTTGYETHAYELIQTITGYQSEGSRAIAAANGALNVAVTSLLYAADTATFNVVSLGAAPRTVLNAGARTLQSIGTSIANVADNGMTNNDNLLLAAAVTNNAAQGIAALTEAANADASSLSLLMDALGTLGVGMREVANAVNANEQSLTEAANAIGSLCDATTVVAASNLNNVTSLQDVANTVPLLVSAMQAVVANALTSSDACNTVILYSYDLATMTRESIIENQIIDARVLSPAAIVASQLATAMQSVALNIAFANAQNFSLLRQRLLATVGAALLLMNEVANNQLLQAQSDINAVGRAMMVMRNVLDLLVVVWEFGVSADYENSAVIAQDVVVTAALDAFNGAATVGNLQAMGAALIAYNNSIVTAAS